LLGPPRERARMLQRSVIAETSAVVRAMLRLPFQTIGMVQRFLRNV
jgi:hypothetical protein